MIFLLFRFFINYEIFWITSLLFILQRELVEDIWDGTKILPTQRTGMEIEKFLEMGDSASSEALEREPKFLQNLRVQNFHQIY